MLHECGVVVLGRKQEVQTRKQETGLTDDYSREVEVLERLLRPGQPGTGCMPAHWVQPEEGGLAYIGNAEVELLYNITLSELPEKVSLWTLWIMFQDATEQEREEERLDLYDHVLDGWTIRMPTWVLDVGVWFLYRDMESEHQALLRLYTLAVNNYSWDGVHDFACDTLRELAHHYWDEPGAIRKHWDILHCSGLRIGKDSVSRNIINYLIGTEVDLENWCEGIHTSDRAWMNSVDDDVLAYVQNNNILRRLFPGVYHQEAEWAVALILKGLRSEQPHKR